jgi:outer membrane immunogenic protein
MKAVLVALTIGFALATGSASAADLYPLKSPPPVFNWTGCYINAGAGYGMWDQKHYSETYPGLAQLTNPMNSGGEGWLGTFGGGCDYQVSSRLVIGAFGDYDVMNLTGAFLDPWANFVACVPGTVPSGCLGNETEQGAWGAGGRIGFLVTPRLLTYLNGGYTQAHFSQISLGGVLYPSSTGTPYYYPARTPTAAGSLAVGRNMAWAISFR